VEYDINGEVGNIVNAKRFSWHIQPFQTQQNKWILTPNEIISFVADPRMLDIL
jgi:hypothetical protein